MLESNEFIVFILAIPAFVFMLRSAKNGDGPEFRDIWLLKAAFGVQLTAWFFTNVEALMLNEIFNCLEHISECVSSVLVLAWLVLLVKQRKETAL